MPDDYIARLEAENAELRRNLGSWESADIAFEDGVEAMATELEETDWPKRALRAETDLCALRGELAEAGSQVKSIASDFQYAQGRYQQADEQIATLRIALMDLLDDTQHRSHDCGEVSCPVAIAREVLATTRDDQSELDRLEAEIATLRTALEDLIDVQNGPPLIEYTDAWNEAMEQAWVALAATKEE